MKTKPKVLSLRQIPADDLPELLPVKERYLEQFDMTFSESADEETAGKNISGQDAVIVPWTRDAVLSKDVLARADSLKLIAATYGGVKANIDADWALDHDIRLTCTGIARARSVAEFTLALMMDASLHVSRIHFGMRSGKTFPRFGYTRELTGRKIGIIGLGAVSRDLIYLLKPFKASISVFSSHASKEEADRLGVRLRSLQELLSSSDIVVVLTGLTDETYHMIGETELALLKPGAVLVNTARGKLIDEAALIACLEKGDICAALDVYEEEPPDADNPLRSMENVVLTAHSANSTREMDVSRWGFILDELANFFEGLPLRNEIDRMHLQRMSDS
jgi:D-3-phosphoglycerate dehydrogenase